MEYYTTEKGTRLYYRVFYDIGGYNYFTGKHTARGYYLEVRRQPHIMAAFSSLADPQGAIKYLLKEVNRQSEKQKQEAEAEALPTLEYIVKVYNDRGMAI